MNKLAIITLIIISVSLNALVQGSLEEHPIDVRLTECHENEDSQTTFGIMECEANAREEWDAECSSQTPCTRN